MAEDDDQVRFVAQFGGVFADGFDHGKDMPRADFRRSGKVADEVAQNDADDSDTDAPGGFDDVRLHCEKRALVIDDIR